MSQQPLRIAPFVMRWNRRWVSGERFAQEYAAGISAFASEVAQAAIRAHRTKHCPMLCDVQSHAVVWAAVLVSFEAASFREHDRETLLALLLEQLRPSWAQGEVPDSEFAAAILQRSMAYFATRDRKSPLNTAERFVSWYLRALGLPERVGSSALARHLSANFSHRILRDIYLLSAASRLRSAVASLMERQIAARIANIDNRGVSIWEAGSPDHETAASSAESHWDGHPIEAVARVATASR